MIGQFYSILFYLNWPLKTLEILIYLPSPEVGFSVYNLMQEECQKICLLPLQKMIPIILEFCDFTF